MTCKIAFIAREGYFYAFGGLRDGAQWSGGIDLAAKYSFLHDDT